MNSYSKHQSRIRSFWLALTILAATAFSTPLWSADTAESEEQTQQPQPKNDGQTDQTAEESKTADDFKPSEEISEDFPVPLPSDI